jgi:hypothetical protein
VFINIRKLAALDLVFHGSRFVVIEFGGAVVLAAALAALTLRSALSAPGRPVVWEIALRVFLATVGANYLPLLLHTVSLIRSGTAREEVAAELQQVRESQRRYGTQQLLLVVPFAVLAISVAQMFTRRRSANSGG